MRGPEVSRLRLRARNATVYATLSITGSPAAIATVSVAYSFTPTLAGGKTPYRALVLTGTLPSGLSFNTTTGAITGTPLSTKDQTDYTITLTDDRGVTATLDFTIQAVPLPNDLINVSLGPHSKLSLRSQLAATAALVPSGNTITVSSSDRPKLQMTLGETYTAGDAVMGAPVAAYTGVEATGYGVALADAPVDPTRLANRPKPILRLMTPWRQAFTDRLVLVFMARAVGGISKVRVYCEGATLDLTEATNYKYTDVNGVERWIHDVYVCELDADNYTIAHSGGVAAGASGDATRGVRVFAEAFAVDTNFQNRVIGGITTTVAAEQFTFYPVINIHDYLVTVNTSLPVAYAGTNPAWSTGTAAANFHDVSDALAFVGKFTRQSLTVTVSMLRPLIEIRTSGTYSYTTASTSSFGFTGRGYCTVKCATAITAELGRSSWDPALLIWRPGYQGVELRGPGITLNSTYWSEFGAGGTGVRHWFNGITSEADIDFHQYLDDGGNVRGTINFTPSAKFLTDCDLSYTSTGPDWVAVNNTRRGLNYDYAGMGWVTYGEVVQGISAQPWAVTYPAMTITNTNPAATVQKVGGNGQSSCTLKLVNGTTTTITLSNLKVSDAYDQIIALGNGWGATLQATPDDRVTDRCTTFLQTLASGPQGAWGPTAVGAGGLALYTYCDIHIDGWQPTSNDVDNFYWGKGRLFEATMQDFLFGFTPLRDTWFEDIAVDSLSATTIPAQYGQWSTTAVERHFYHVVMKGFTDTGGLLLMGNGSASTEYDAYCRAEGHYWAYFVWSSKVNANNASPVFTDCAFSSNVSISGDLDTAFQNPVNCSAGGTRAANFPYRTEQNLLPDPSIGSIATADMNAFDASGIKRLSGCVKGPLVEGLPNGTTLTAAELLELAIVTPSNATGDDLATVTIEYRDGAGNTGSLVTVTVVASVA